MNADPESLRSSIEYFSSTCGSCGREATVTEPREVGQMCAPCARIWTELMSMAYCNCPALRGHHSLACSIRMRDHAS